MGLIFVRPLLYLKRIGMELDTSDLSQSIIDALDYIYEELMNRYPNVNFTIRKKVFNSNAIAFVIHDENVFFDNAFQNWVFKELQEEYLQPKHIMNIVFTYQKI